MPIQRADGITASEQYLKQLCDQTFLSLWSYSGVYNDKGLEQNRQGEEVCDLLAIFDNDIIIFSDKDCQFPDTGDLSVDWKRWFKKSIQKSAQQLWGAERWIKKYPDHLFLDKSCSQKFPLYIPDLSTARFHLIAVAHSSSDRCLKEIGGMGSLKINNSIKASKHGDHPFFIGDLDENKSFVHVLDDVSLDEVLSTLDTVSDFVAYLIKKEELLRSEFSISAPSEVDLLAYYHKFIDENGERAFLLPSEINSLHIEEGCWRFFEDSSERHAKLVEDQISYLWDALIYRFSEFTLEGNLLFSSHLGVAEQEVTIRHLARENRFHRRILSSLLNDLVLNAPTHGGELTVRYLQHPSNDSLGYVFMVFPAIDSWTYEQYRDNRRDALKLRCHVAKVRNPKLKSVIGIATESMRLDIEGRTEDMIHIDLSDWSQEDQSQIEQIMEDFGLSHNLSQYQIHHDEYPSS
jgi:hypothetical protein